MKWWHKWVVSDSYNLLWSLDWWWKPFTDHYSGSMLKQSLSFSLHLERGFGHMYHEYTPNDESDYHIFSREKMRKKSSIFMIRETRTVTWSSALMNKIEDPLPSHLSSSNYSKVWLSQSITNCRAASFISQNWKWHTYPVAEWWLNKLWHSNGELTQPLMIPARQSEVKRRDMKLHKQYDCCHVKYIKYTHKIWTEILQNPNSSCVHVLGLWCFSFYFAEVCRFSLMTLNVSLSWWKKKSNQHIL